MRLCEYNYNFFLQKAFLLFFKVGPPFIRRARTVRDSGRAYSR